MGQVNVIDRIKAEPYSKHEENRRIASERRHQIKATRIENRKAQRRGVPSTSSNRANQVAFERGVVAKYMKMAWAPAFKYAKSAGYTGLKACIFADAACA